MSTYETALSALADPTRRAILEILAEKPRPVGEVAARLPITRPAVSQHLRVLREAGLVRDQQRGTRRIYRVEPQGLSELRAYVERFWQEALESFRQAAENLQGGRDDERAGD